MRFSENWLREWVDPDGVDTVELCEALTLIGLEVDQFESSNPGFEDIVVARIDSVAPHPDADKLRVCQVDDGTADLLQVVCGAPNARPGLIAPLARVGGRLPDGTRLRKARIRGVESHGMLCSAAELQLSEQADGLMELSAKATIGDALEEYLQLDDTEIEIELTPDRGDCLSIRGLARDVSARFDIPLSLHEFNAIKAQVEDTWPVRVESSSACVRYAGRIVRDIDISKASPRWMVERLRRSGVRSINAAVDVTNYVMLELGQPMHAFDLDKLQGAIQVRLAGEGETMTLLDGREVRLHGDTTVIADDSGAIGIAGVMGGLGTGVTSTTQSIFFESALFLPQHIIGKPVRYNAPSESAHRFERGVDPLLQREALEYATGLLINICGGKAGPVRDWQDSRNLPLGERILLRRSHLKRILGIHPGDDVVRAILERLGVECQETEAGWHVTPPSHRYDLRIEEDYIEEVGRIHGFDRIPRLNPVWSPQFRSEDETALSLADVRSPLLANGYQEVVTYSFVQPDRQQCLRPELSALPLSNPLSAELAVMRTTLAGGLIETLRHNLNRGARRVRIFETGLRFIPRDPQGKLEDAHLDLTLCNDIQLNDDLVQQSVIGGLLFGPREAERWNRSDTAELDFFDLKADVQALLAQANGREFEIVSGQLEMLHPGQRASVLENGRAVGWFGRLSPALLRRLDLEQAPLLFELSLSALDRAQRPAAHALSRFPSVRRDLALLVDVAVPHQALLDTVHSQAPAWLDEVITFDVFTGGKLPKGKRSIGLGLILQHPDRTLEDAEVDAAVKTLTAALEQAHGATLRA